MHVHLNLMQLESYNKQFDLKILGGHFTNEINLSRILLRPSMIKYFKENHPNINLNNYKMSKIKEVGALTRMEYQDSLTDDEFIEQNEKEPINVSNVMIEVFNPETGDVQVDSYYDIYNGRHRITSAIVRGFEKITADISF